MQTKNVLVVALAVLSIVAIFLLQSQNTWAADEPKPNNSYVFAEDVYPQVTFKFREAIVTYDFQAYQQTNNLFNTAGGGVSRSTSPEFTLQRIVGNTPYLHKAVDQTWETGGKTSGLEYPYREFDVTVDFVQAGQPVRTFSYGDCSVTNYKITTDFDKEEGYTTGGKTGFAVIETYTFTCNGYKPVNPTYNTIQHSK